MKKTRGDFEKENIDVDLMWTYMTSGKKDSFFMCTSESHIETIVRRVRKFGGKIAISYGEQVRPFTLAKRSKEGYNITFSLPNDVPRCHAEFEVFQQVFLDYIYDTMEKVNGVSKCALTVCVELYAKEIQETLRSLGFDIQTPNPEDVSSDETLYLYTDGKDPVTGPFTVSWDTFSAEKMNAIASLASLRKKYDLEEVKSKIIQAFVDAVDQHRDLVLYIASEYDDLTNFIMKTFRAFDPVPGWWVAELKDPLVESPTHTYRYYRVNFTPEFLEGVIQMKRAALKSIYTTKLGMGDKGRTKFNNQLRVYFVTALGMKIIQEDLPLLDFGNSSGIVQTWKRDLETPKETPKGTPPKKEKVQTDVIQNGPEYTVRDIQLDIIKAYRENFYEVVYANRFTETVREWLNKQHFKLVFYWGDYYKDKQIIRWIKENIKTTIQKWEHELFDEANEKTTPLQKTPTLDKLLEKTLTSTKKEIVFQNGPGYTLRDAKFDIIRAYHLGCYVCLFEHDLSREMKEWLPRSGFDLGSCGGKQAFSLQWIEQKKIVQRWIQEELDVYSYQEFVTTCKDNKAALSPCIMDELERRHPDVFQQTTICGTMFLKWDAQNPVTRNTINQWKMDQTLLESFKRSAVEYTKCYGYYSCPRVRLTRRGVDYLLCLGFDVHVSKKKPNRELVCTVEWKTKKSIQTVNQWETELNLEFPVQENQVRKRSEVPLESNYYSKIDIDNDLTRILGIIQEQAQKGNRGIRANMYAKTADILSKRGFNVKFSLMEDPRYVYTISW